jgi:hypothetical protein
VLVGHDTPPERWLNERAGEKVYRESRADKERGSAGRLIATRELLLRLEIGMRLVLLRLREFLNSVVLRLEMAGKVAKPLAGFWFTTVLRYWHRPVLKVKMRLGMRGTGAVRRYTQLGSAEILFRLEEYAVVCFVEFTSVSNREAFPIRNARSGGGRAAFRVEIP